MKVIVDCLQLAHLHTDIFCLQVERQDSVWSEKTENLGSVSQAFVLKRCLQILEALYKAAFCRKYLLQKGNILLIFRGNKTLASIK